MNTHHDTLVATLGELRDMRAALEQSSRASDRLWHQYHAELGRSTFVNLVVEAFVRSGILLLTLWRGAIGDAWRLLKKRKQVLGEASKALANASRSKYNLPGKIRARQQLNRARDLSRSLTHTAMAGGVHEAGLGGTDMAARSLAGPSERGRHSLPIAAGMVEEYDQLVEAAEHAIERVATSPDLDAAGEAISVLLDLTDLGSLADRVTVRWFESNEAELDRRGEVFAREFARARTQLARAIRELDERIRVVEAAVDAGRAGPTLR